MVVTNLKETSSSLKTNKPHLEPRISCRRGKARQQVLRVSPVPTLPQSRCCCGDGCGDVVVCAQPEGAELHFLAIAKPPTAKMVHGISESSRGTPCQAQPQNISVVRKEALPLDPEHLVNGVWQGGAEALWEEQGEDGCQDGQASHENVG